VVEQASNFTGSIPEHYDRDLGPVLFADFAVDMARRVAATRPMRVLEIAAGSGIVTRQLRNVLPAGAHLTATDLNPPMLEVARSKFRAGEQVTFQPADGTTLPFPDAVFDAVVCQFGVMFFADKAKSYREVHRVLARGGHYLFSVWDSHARNPFGRLAHEVIGSFFPLDPPQFYRVPFSYHQLDPIKEALTEAGFGDLRIAVLGEERHVVDIDAFAHGVIYGNPVIEQIRARRSADPDGIVAAMAERLRREFGDNPCRIPMQTITFEARRRR
jgi:ubiquinone/menaquinone biosynthesis C-methylase UbiE